MTTKKFEIAGRPARPSEPTTTVRDDALARFIEGAEAMTTMTVQIPERLKHALKRAALDRKTTVKALVIESLEGYLAETKQ
jgi:hypothetical protein